MTGQMVIYQMNLWMIEMNIVLDIRGQVSLLIGTQGFKRQDMGAKNHVMETPHVSGNILADTLLVTQPMLQRWPNQLSEGVKIDGFLYPNFM